MMLNIDIAELREGFNQHLVLTAMVIFLVAAFLIYFALGPWFSVLNFPVPAAQPESYNNVKELGERLFTDYLYQFELAGELLTAAVVASVVLAFSGIKKRKVQNISAQVKASKATRLKIINIKNNEQDSSC